MDEETKTISFELSCPVKSVFLRHIRQFIVQLAEDVSFSEEEVSQIEIAVDEACSNIIEHAYNHSTDFDKEGKKIYVRVEIYKHGIKIVVGDRGKGIQPHHIHRTKNLKQYKTSRYHRGLGTYIITNFMDDVLFHTEEGYGTTVEMFKYRRDNDGFTRAGIK